MRTPTQRLADHLLGESAETWIKAKRDAGLSWRRVSLVLRDETDGQIDVTPTTLISWFDEDHLLQRDGAA